MFYLILIIRFLLIRVCLCSIGFNLVTVLSSNNQITFYIFISFYWEFSFENYVIHCLYNVEL